MDPHTLQLIGDTFELVGTLSIAYAALSVHHRFRHEHKVDDKVFKAMRLEIKVGIVGIFLILIGFGSKLIAFAAL